jgi:hypothetical protein
LNSTLSIYDATTPAELRAAVVALCAAAIGVGRCGPHQRERQLAEFIVPPLPPDCQPDGGGRMTGYMCKDCFALGYDHPATDCIRNLVFQRDDAALDAKRQLDLRYAANRELVALQRETDALKAKLAKVPTLAEAEAGGLPEPMTADEWAAMHRASAGTEAKRGAAEVAA